MDTVPDWEFEAWCEWRRYHPSVERLVPLLVEAAGYENFRKLCRDIRDGPTKKAPQEMSPEEIEREKAKTTRAAKARMHASGFQGVKGAPPPIDINNWTPRD